MSTHHGPPGWINNTIKIPGHGISNTISIAPSTTWTVGTTTTIPYTTVVTTGFQDINLDRFGTPSYSDLVEGLRPGTEWFEKGSTLRLKENLFMFSAGETSTSMHLASSIFVYLGLSEDLEVGKERHWFLTDSGQLVQYNYWVYDLGWRGNIRSKFEIFEGTNE